MDKEGILLLSNDVVSKSFKRKNGNQYNISTVNRYFNKTQHA